MAKTKIPVISLDEEKKSFAKKGNVKNLALRGIEADFGPEHADTSRRDLYRNLRAASIPATVKRRHA